MKSDNNILTMKNISKTFPGVKALNNVEFNLKKGEVNALMGENGAGKSTLIRLLTGVETFETGMVVLNDKKILVKSPIQAEKLGISTVYQEINLCMNLSVAENIMIGREPKKFGMINWNEVELSASKALKNLNIDIDVTKKLESYSLAIQQMVAIARAFYFDSTKILILDEPTSSLDKSEVIKLFEVIDILKSKGIGIIFITHFLDQVYRISDKITILRNGELVGEYETRKLTQIELISKMLGKEFEELSTLKKVKEKENSSDIKNLFIKTKGLGKKFSVNPINMFIKKGEVLGLAGLLGSGRTEVARLLFGIDKKDCGEMFIEDKKINIKNPQLAIKNSIALCPENRKTEGIIEDLSVKENIILALQSKRGVFKYIKESEQDKIAKKYIDLLNIKTSNQNQVVKSLSGGNQQKVILARWLLTEPVLLILDEPTRGIDVGAKAEIQKLIINLAKEGMAVMFISSELEELIRCCTSMIVLRDRSKIDELFDEDINEYLIMKTLAGGKN
ncbi:MAG: sugar ABC transporter ATP-binding protein [Clostridiales bacterium]